MSLKKSFTFFAIILFCSSIFADENFGRRTKINFKVLSISKEKDGQDNKSRTFNMGEKIYIKLSITGLEKNNKKEFYVQSDFLMVAQGLKTILNKGKIIDQKLDASTSDELILKFSITPGSDIKPGKYNIEITVKDMIAKKYNKYPIAISIK